MFVAVFATPFGICAIFNKNINNYFKPKSCNTFHSFQALMRKILNKKASTLVQEHLVSFNMILYSRVLPTSWVLARFCTPRLLLGHSGSLTSCHDLQGM